MTVPRPLSAADTMWHDHCRMSRDIIEELRMSRHTEPSEPNESADSNRDPYRDNDDVRDPTPPDQRSDIKSDSKSEARGDARENVGRTARGTAAQPTGPEGNDRTKGRSPGEPSRD